MRRFVLCDHNRNNESLSNDLGLILNCENTIWHLISLYYVQSGLHLFYALTRSLGTLKYRIKGCLTKLSSPSNNPIPFLRFLKVFFHSFSFSQCLCIFFFSISLFWNKNNNKKIINPSLTSLSMSVCFTWHSGKAGGVIDMMNDGWVSDLFIFSGCCHKRASEHKSKRSSSENYNKVLV